MSVDLVKQDAKLFCYYIDLTSYDVFLVLFNYLSPLAQNMQYVLNAGRMHFCHKPGQAASTATLHYSHSRRQNVWSHLSYTATLTANKQYKRRVTWQLSSDDRPGDVAIIEYFGQHVEDAPHGLSKKADSEWVSEWVVS